MPLLPFDAQPIWFNLAIFAVAAAIIWLAGTRLAIYADILAERTGLGRAFIGLVLLATATSLPEIATTSTAALAGNPRLAANNILGGVATQLALLALADFLVARGSLTFFTPRPILLLQGMTLIVLLSVALGGMIAGTTVILLGVGLWTPLLFGVYIFSVYASRRYEARWRPIDMPDQLEDQVKAQEMSSEQYGRISVSRAVWLFAAGAAVLLVAGWVLSQVADTLAAQTGLGESFVGATLLALSTSLPEASTTVAAVRIGAYSLAISNIFGSCAFMVALFFPVDLLYQQGAILQAVDRSAMFAGLAGIVLAAVYIVGLIERRNVAILRMGLDSVVVVGVYLVTLVVLYSLA